MSNVIIGIIGVILFIGLAVAGALFLGDRFTSAGNSSKAAASLAQIAQISAAIQMYETKTGQTFAAGTPLDSLTPRFLRSVPTNPTTGPVAATYTSQAVSSGDRTSLVLMELGTRAQGVCLAIASQSGLSSIPVANDVASIPAGPSGCFTTSAAVGSTRAAAFYAYNRTWGPAAAVAAATPTPTPTPTTAACVPTPKNSCITTCTYQDPNDPSVLISGYCDSTGKPITGAK